MHYIRNICLLLVAIAVGILSAPAVQAQSVGNCEAALGEAYLDVNNVRARILNNGNLFWRGSPHVYEVPKGGASNAIFASGIWMGGQVAGQLRLAGSTYGPYEFWAGPLNDDGTAPSDCEPFDHVWKISGEDIANYESGGGASPDLADWPTGMGAPTVDANGDSIDLTSQPLASRVDRKINLAAGERPDILGDMMLWWVMNDRGNQHTRTDTPPMGVEVHGSAFAFNTAGAIGNTTFYKYRIQYKGSVPLENTYMGLFSDPDLGNFQDDYVGSDTTLGMGFVYNADNDDEGGEGYGEAPPAAGYDFFQGPLVDDNGIDDNGDGQVDEDNERLKMTAFAFYNNGGGIQGDPGNGQDMYNFMQGRWKDGQRFTLGGNGLGFSNIPTSFMFPGNPPGFWSEFDSDDQGSAISPADRRFVMATGPFTIKPADEQTLVFGIVTSFGADNLDSVQKMKSDDAIAQAAFDIDFQIPSPPNAPRVTTSVDDGTVLLEWGYRPSDNNYLDTYNVIDPFCSEVDCDYALEGYKVYQYENSADQDGTIIATYDVANGVTKIVDTDGGDLLIVTADGTDNGLAHSHAITSLTNFTNYEFGVQAYAFNDDSYPKAYHGPITRVNVVPQKTDLVLSEDAVAAARSTDADVFGTAGDANIGNGSVEIGVVNPANVTGHSYEVEFYLTTLEAGKRGPVVARELDALELAKPLPELAPKGGAAEVVTYDVRDVTAGTKVFDGAAASNSTGAPAPEGIDVLQYDGLSMNVGGAPDGFLDFTVVANASGAVDPPSGASADWRSFPGTGRADRSRQQSTGTGAWHIATAMSGACVTGTCGDYASFLQRSITGRGGWPQIMPYDWEIRFEDGAFGVDWWTSGIFTEVPFSVWRTGISTPDDTSDDVRYIAVWLDDNGNGVFDMIANDHDSSGGANDPYTDWIYVYSPNDMSAGQSGYDTWLATAQSEGSDGGSTWGSENPMGRLVFYGWNHGDVSDGTLDAVAAQDRMPEAGTVFRFSTTKPNQPADVFSFSTDGLGAQARDEGQQIAALDDIGIVPNPYKGASSYEVSQLVDQVRFTNMPDQATIRIFTLAGTLVRTLEKNSASAMFPWDLSTEDNLPIASGMYIIHIETNIEGKTQEKVLKFGVVKKRVQLNAY